MIAALLLLASAAAASSTAPSARPPEVRERPYWLKTYSLAPYREAWRSDLSVKKLDAALPKVVAAIEKNGGRLTQPLANFARSADEQQLSVVVPLKKAKTLLAALRKLGKMEEPFMRPQAERIPLAQVREKLARLLKEKAEGQRELSRLPAAAEALDEMIEHLSNAEAAARSEGDEALWNMTVKEAR